MKNFFVSALLLASSSVFAAQTIPWEIDTPNTSWHIANPTGKTNVSFTVYRSMPGKPGNPDPMSLMCSNGIFTVNPGQTVTCQLTNFVQGEFHIATFKSGSEGTYTVS